MKETKNAVTDNMGNTWSSSMFNNKSCDEMKGYIERIEGASPHRNNFVPSTEPYIKLIEATKERKEASLNGDFHDCCCIVVCNCDDIKNV